VYLRRTDGSPAMRLGGGALPAALSPDGTRVLASTAASGHGLVVMPTGAGESRTIELEGVERLAWLPDSRHALVDRRGSKRTQVLVVDTDGVEPPRTIRDGVRLTVTHAASPDGRSFLGRLEKKLVVVPLDDGEPRVLDGIEDGEISLGWADDGASIFVARFAKRGLPIAITRVDLASGHREPVRELKGPAHRGELRVLGLVITPDGEGHAYSYVQTMSDLYLVEGLTGAVPSVS
jgi:hypothetical protein